LHGVVLAALNRGVAALHRGCTGACTRRFEDEMDNTDDDRGRLIEVKRISGSGTLPGLLDVIRSELMTGCGIRFATDSFDVVTQVCAVADRMGGIVEINLSDD